MSPKDIPGAQPQAPDNPSDESDDSTVASKLSRELSNWRRQRSVSRPRRAENGNGSHTPSEPARTIRVRGHETLVVRKAKIANKLPSAPADND